MATLAGIVVGVAFILLVTQIIITHRRNAHLSYYCDTCSQYLGTGRQRERVCPNCGDFRYYTKENKER